MLLKKSVIDLLDISNFVKNEFNLDYDCYYSDKVFLLELNVLGNVNKLFAKRRRNRKGIYSFLYFIEINKGKFT